MRNKQTKAFGLVLFIIITTALMTGCGFTYVINATNRLDRDDAKEFTIEKNVVDPITDINIRTGIAEVELIESDQFYVEIEYLYWEDEPEYSLENGELYFNDTDCLPNSYSINFNLDNHIRIYLPKGSKMNNIRIEDASGDVNISSFIAEELDITVSYGDFTMKEAAAADTDITLSSGTSNITDFQSGEIDFTNSYGNANFTNINVTPLQLAQDTTFDRFNVTMSSGDVKMKGLASKTIEITNSYGDITIDTLTTDEIELNLSSGNCEIMNGDIISTDIRNSYGDVTLGLLGVVNDYSLDLDTSYGKIQVEENHYEDHVTIQGNGTRMIKTELSSGDVAVDFTE
jgi:DUF4097 and DUF4098 domain-containing protein YvlB